MVKARVEERMAKQTEQMHEQLHKLIDEMQKKDETIARLTTALESKQMDQKHVQLTTGGEVVELVSTADVKALEKRVEACEKKNDAQDAKIGMTVATVHRMREER